METICGIAERHGLLVVEDAAQGVHALYRGRPLGSLGHLATYSFHTTKNYVCGEGGALCVNSPRLVRRAEILREKGTNRSQFYRGEVDKYSWIDVGGSHLPSELSCAFLLGQLEQLDAINARRKEIFDAYRRQLQPLELEGLLRLPIIPAECQPNYHMFYVLLPNMATRDALLAHLKEQGIGAVFHYVPLHTAPMGQRFGYQAADLPVTVEMSGRLLRLPFYCELTDDDLRRIANTISAFLLHERSARRAPVDASVTRRALVE
jgi:dTDP-4-amino-4,6-dideoxygalactose transaminase